jgi:hypothetical protein
VAQPGSNLAGAVVQHHIDDGRARLSAPLEKRQRQRGGASAICESGGQDGRRGVTSL